MEGEGEGGKGKGGWGRHKSQTLECVRILMFSPTHHPKSKVKKKKKLMKPNNNKNVHYRHHMKWYKSKVGKLHTTTPQTVMKPELSLSGMHTC